MRRAYSFAHGTTVAAEDISYRHCRDDRVECEICHDRVFKSVRRLPGREIHFLSHHRAASGNAKECEARVATRMKEEAAAASTGVDRGQALGLRLGALRRVLDRQFPAREPMATTLQKRSGTVVPDPDHPYGYAIPCSLAFTHEVAGVAFRIAAALDGHEVELNEGTDCEGAKAVAHMLSEERARRPHARHTADQRRWARDMTAMLVRKESRRPMMALMHHAVADILSWSPEDLSDEEVRRVRMLRALSATPHPDLSLHDEPIDPNDPDSDSVGRRTDIMIVHRMQGILLELDYAARVPAAPVAKPKRKPRPKRTHRRR